MNVQQLNPIRRVTRLGAGARTLAVTFALGALLAVPGRAAMFRPVLSQGGINIQSNTTISITGVATNQTGGTNATLNVRGLQAPYDVQMAPIGTTNWSHGAYTSLKAPNHAGTVTVSNTPGNSQFRLLMLGLTNYGGRYVDYTNFAGISNVWVGANKCNGCHGDKVAEWGGTLHAHAIDALRDTNGVFQPIQFGTECIACHSVGWKQPGGFRDLTNTPHLGGVGCETCHGPANAHVNISGRQYHPVATLAPELCGGCHTDAHHPTYDEYIHSGHYEVSPDVSYGIAAGVGTFNPGTLVTNIGGTNLTTWYGYIDYTNGPNAGKSGAASGIYNSLRTVAGITSGYGRGMSCGPCHSAAVRSAMLQNYEARQGGITNALALPTATDGATWGPTCATCHDPHSAENPHQLRQPKYSTNYFTFFTGSVLATNLSTNVYWSTNLFTSINGIDVVSTPGTIETNVSQDIRYENHVFASQYNPDIQVCAQCHNSRGARWDGLSYAWTITNATYVTNGSVISYMNSQFGWVFGKTWTITNTVVIGSTTNRIYGLTNATPSYSRPPHHSPQYNMLIGIVQPTSVNTDGTDTLPYLNGSSNVFHLAETPNVSHGHSLQTNGCAACHLAGNTVSVPTDLNPNYTGHEFLPLIAGISGTDGCRASGCHDAESAATVSNRLDTLNLQVTNRIAAVVAQLNNWAFLKGTNVFGAVNATKYGSNAWEYSTPGALVTFTNATPSATDQLKLPTAIKQTRFELYMTSYGNLGSLGIHNPTYTRYLLDSASNKVWQASQ